MPNIGTPELIIVLLVVLLLVGGKKLPELARSVGQSKREFNKAVSGSAEEVQIAQAEPVPVEVEAQPQVVSEPSELESRRAEILAQLGTSPDSPVVNESYQRQSVSVRSDVVPERSSRLVM